ncbi:hypothetical protein PtrSN002B_007498 [Pyrenophora tritici-repentis]|uniref:Uncharacterized protein n=2 Tax=Pyrenophora tritici-repentis TaxID=45151 RepID=A0A2W1EPI0_9PLEO|nr:uncharacterized protein PTRG_09640 [Pyrenophora tritici-repentis Pt-1C-BFP]KAA8617825.1 hypothetical protein PtrV1_09332 [Pyrenophora tritici-repentis]EDU42691.1 hypothetical protein PTRG_09640 [Pyrenophora tritici-repentis Pt-1C-BFP]KAF7443226.1 hypothetical protein A1F99_127330 [Pyrenophora tritici-repentis]KAF7568300.1 hypothetical protein PtrM4_129130 [Pyrenophora tritici-repentis]KAG9377085.1 hypothetical protein A1F94_012685 [Pyrenophora tritici-repentis]
MALSTEQSQMRFLAVVLPALTLCAHTLLALSFILPGSDLDSACFSLTYNVLAGCASTLGLVGAVWSIPSLVSAYTILHTTTLSFVTIALVNMVLPFDFRLLNPVIPSYALDGSSICRDIDAGFGWNAQWLEKCSTSFSVIKFGAACFGLVLMIAQWWALMSVRRWGHELRYQRRNGSVDVEQAGLAEEKDEFMSKEKTEF